MLLPVFLSLVWTEDGWAQGTAPLLTAQPPNQTVAAGAAVSFSVTATGTEPLFYQWCKDGVNLTNDDSGGWAGISGATTATLTLSSVQSDKWGAYSVIISNALGAVTSRVARLTVLVPPSTGRQCF